MKIDTLVLSGGSTKVPAFIGSFRVLKEYNILNDNLDGINHIITCSVGMLYALLILLKVSDSVIEESIKQFCFSDILNTDNLGIDSLLFELGLFDNEKVACIINTVLREKYSKDSMTMLELYNLTGIKLTSKVCNHTRACVEYISYENEPELSITKLLQMTTAIPLFFKPIKHNNCLYVDGGIAGGFPIEFAGDNYIGIQLKGPWKTDNEHTIMDDIPLINYIIRGLAVSTIDTSKPDSRNISLVIDIHFANFKLTLDEKIKLIEDGYKLTKEHIEKYNLTNDLFNTESSTN